MDYVERKIGGLCPEEKAVKTIMKALDSHSIDTYTFGTLLAGNGNALHLRLFEMFAAYINSVAEMDPKWSKINPNLHKIANELLPIFAKNGL